MTDYKKSAIIFFIISAISYIASAILFFSGDESLAVIFLCLGSSNLCVGASNYRKDKDAK